MWEHQTLQGKLIPADGMHGPGATYFILKEQEDIPHYMSELMLYVKKVFVLSHAGYVEHHRIAFDLCMLYFSEGEVPDISALQQHQSSSLSTASHNWTVCLVKFAPPCLRVHGTRGGT